MMDLRKVHDYYAREDVQNFLLEFGKDREVVGVFRNGSFSQRPNVILYPNDVLAMVKTGVVEFHSSLERWTQPMSLKQDNHGQLRKGWDIIMDVDCELFEHGKIASEAFIWGLRKHDIKNVSIKFTGGTGFHIGIPWESIPKVIDYKPAATLYPELARKMVLYLKDYVFERLEKNLFKKFSAEEMAQQVNKPLGKILTDDGLNAYAVVDVDPILISPRHLFRMPYSLNAKTFLVSLPIDPDRLGSFERMQAKSERVRVLTPFLASDGRDGEADMLIAEALDWNARMRKKEEKRLEHRNEITRPVPIERFPPCVKNILNGLQDGRKRSMFILINFLRSSKWTWDDIEKFVTEWNKNNKPPLPESHVRSHIRWHRTRNKEVLPPNCSNEGWYKNFGVCTPDEKCAKVKNPVNYALRGMKAEEEKKSKPKAKAKKRSRQM
jgi:hypothetical protein